MDHSSDTVWKQCLSHIQQEISQRAFKTWFEPLAPKELTTNGEQTKLTVELPSKFYYEWLQSHYYNVISDALSEAIGPSAQLDYIINTELDERDHESVDPTTEIPSLDLRSNGESNGSSTSVQAVDATLSGDGSPTAEETAPPSVVQDTRAVGDLSTHYTFENFIEGACNRLARSSACAIAENPGQTSFNPFVVYGKVGLGKTHLIQAIGNAVNETHGHQYRVRYLSSERFTTEFIRAIQNNEISSFSSYYREVDVLIVDDVQFFEGKEKTQEEFFHLFNTLHQSGKQIVLSADRPPNEISGLEERLLSRFQWGLTADVQAPKYETRIAILQRKLAQTGDELPRDVIEFLAQHITHNIRALEGAINRLRAYSELQDRGPTCELAREVINDLVGWQSPQATIEDIQRITADHFDVSEDLLLSRTRTRSVALARQVAMYLSRECTDRTLKSIGMHFGGRDHTTVIHAINTVEDLQDTDDEFRDQLAELERRMNIGIG